MLNAPLTGWRGRRVWLIGASTGIGRATAEALLERGAQVIVSARNDAALQEIAARWPGAQAVPFDASEVLQVRTAAHEVLAGGPLDLAVYCAGYYRGLRATGYDLAEMLRHQEVNYLGALYMLDAVLPGMLQRGAGHLSLVSSVAGYRGLPMSLAYGPTKAALNNLAETLYIDLRPRGIGVSVVCPGFVDTPLTAQNRFRMPAIVTPAQAAEAMIAGWERGRFEIHFPRRFTLAMKAAALLPFGLYQALARRTTGL
jgi:NAD(P)-dependent dehydrogenase (short-subunit alcohol dehydrogenase family)